MQIALVGTGFVADYYMTTLANHPTLSLAGAWDRDPARLEAFRAFHDVAAYRDLDALLADPAVGIVVNLTTPESHCEISRRALAAGKHVYCEKPLAMALAEAEALVAQAKAAGLTLAAAPANGLSDAHRLVEDALRSGRIGAPRLIYAAMEDGPVFRDAWARWRSRSGAPWPGAHEFAIGCTLEHAGYALSWLVTLFGPVESLTAFSAVTFPDKGPGTGSIAMAPDFSVGCLSFRSGAVARLTNGLAAPRDRSLQIFAEKGSLTVRDLWDNRSVVHVEETGAPRPLLGRMLTRAEAKLGRALPWKPVAGRRLPYRDRPGAEALPGFPSRIDFMRGVADQAEAIGRGEAPRFSGALALHITELALALNDARDLPQPYRPRSHF
ncbi:Gfo/Idh/MocA family oxidoreductase [Bosea sp. (in: a-proteobacteria)]|uniref:Gfo/Idh/MocA family protein n=1 Tax=Bosea sp. (in: a-proteobacteria) TaxID=1871050 RepID=UPI00260604CA|nr:Gfo/Idh/MocA family oxidoreductase [Bosea sp. (in: a-proteobacteria)]MCO5090205.1 Gfo/Idh/MocA family oxidoreductase [Bosea sp. (in: a-proteobacteria)]